MQRSIYTWLDVTLTDHITIWHISCENRSMRSEPQGTEFAFDILTPILPCLSPCYRPSSERSIVQWVNSAQINLVMTSTDDCTCFHLTIQATNWMLCDKWEVWNKCRSLPITSVVRHASLKAFFLSLGMEISTWLLVTLTDHKTIWHISWKTKVWGANHKV